MEKINLCHPGASCFSEEEKTKLKEKGWTEEQIKLADNSIIEDKIRELI